jgi:hypothetical protein
MRTFASGATRNLDSDKYDFEGFLSPAVLERFGMYMHGHRVQDDGTLRASDNWQKGIPKDQYIKSLLRHVIDVWKEHRGLPSRDGLQDALCGVIFNSMGYLHEDIKEQRNAQKQQADLSGDESELPAVYP